MLEDNPFQFGSIVREEDFCGRPRTVERLASNFRSGQNAVLLGPRRVGKSSLIHRAAASIPKATLIYADLWGVRTLDDFLRRCVQALDALEDKTSLFTKLARAIPGLTVTMSVDPVTGSPSLTPTFQSRDRPVPESVAQIARLWASLPEDGERIIIALDEFQDLTQIEHSEQVLGSLRREIQTMGKLPFCFCGSVRNDMWRIFAEDRGAFYKSASMLEIDADDFDDWRGFLRGKFEKSKLKIDDDVLDDITRCADGNPGDTQQLCASIWDIAKAARLRKITEKQVQDGLLQIFADERKGYDQILSDVSAQQIAVLRTMAQLGGKSVQSAEFLRAANIPHASSSKAAATRLVQRRILVEAVGELKFSNPFFRDWLLHMRY